MFETRNTLLYYFDRARVLQVLVTVTISKAEYEEFQILRNNFKHKKYKNADLQQRSISSCSRCG